MASPTKRNESVRIRISPEVLARLKVVADALGVPPGTLASVAVGQYVAQQERALALTGQVAEKLGEMLGVQMPEIMEQLRLLGGSDESQTKVPLPGLSRLPTKGS